MACPYCYIPFDGLPDSRETALRVVAVLVDWKTESITVGGGDPLAYSYTEDLITAVKSAADANVFFNLIPMLSRRPQMT